MTHFLASALVDMDGDLDTDSKDTGQRIAASMGVGHGGEVEMGPVPSGILFARLGKRSRPGRTSSSSIPRTWQRHSSGAYAVFAGRLNDRAETCAALGLPKQTPNAQIYCEAVARWGLDADRRLDGDYAAIVWFPDQRRLRLSRSPFSMQPLHYWRDGAKVVVSSNARSLFAAGAPSQVDDRRLVDAMLVNFSDETASWFVDHARVAGGTVVELGLSSRTVHECWSYDDIEPVHFAADEDYVEALDERFAQAVSAAMEGVRQPAIMLSGGLDSPAIASYVLQQLSDGQKLRSYTWVPLDEFTEDGTRPQYFVDESSHVKALKAQYPALEPRFLQEGEDPYGLYLEKYFMLAASPPRSGGNWPFALFEQAARDGNDVLFQGGYGNPTFSDNGDSAFAIWFRTMRWGRLLDELRHDPVEHPFLSKLFRRAIAPNLPRSLHRAFLRWRGTLDTPFGNWSPLKEDCARENGALERAAANDFDPEFLLAADPKSSRLLYRAFANSDLAEMYLGTRLATGIEKRLPMANRSFIEFCWGVPQDQFVRKGTDRWLARRLLSQRLPEKIWQERRTGDDSADWFIHFGRYREGLESELESMRDNPRLNSIFDADRLIRNLREWDGTDARFANHRTTIYNGIGRAVAAARFVNYMEGRNDGKRL